MNQYKLSGFTLLEVLTALVILSVAMSAFYMTFSTTVNSISHLQDKTAAEWVAMNIIAEAQLGMIDIYDRASGKTMMFGHPWYWSAVIIGKEKPVSRIIVDVKKTGRQTLSAHLTGYLRNDLS